MLTFPQTTTAKDIQRNYRKVFDLAKKTKEPIFVLRNNKPEVAIIDVKKLEEMEAIIAVLQSKDEAKSGQVKVLNGSLTNLWNETKED